MSVFIRFLIRVFYLCNIALVVYSLLIYQLSYSATVKHWFGGFLMMSLPVVLILNICFVFLWLLFRSWNFLFSLAILILGWTFINRTYRFDNSINLTSKPNSISVLSYNLMYFDVYSYVHEQKKENALNMLKYVRILDADIKCFQEFYNWDEFKDFRTIRMLKRKNPYYTYMFSTPGNENGQGEIGLAIFSKYPIIHKEEKYWKPNNNGLLAADIVRGNDTIRVINVQLKSMGVRVDKLIQARNDEDAAKKEAKTIFGQLKEGFELRAIQVKMLEDWILKSPYPVLVCGDFNELPYGYAYGRIRKSLKNAFENAGNKFGFTYHRRPGYLRIDNQFFDDRYFEINGFRTFDDIPYSDHYPIMGRYVLTHSATATPTNESAVP